jgi:hypothetical protein
MVQRILQRETTKEHLGQEQTQRDCGCKETAVCAVCCDGQRLGSETPAVSSSVGETAPRYNPL